MCIQLGPQFHSLEEEDLKTDVYKERNRNPVFGRIRSEFQSQKKKEGQNSNVWKDKIRFPIRITIAPKFA